MRFEPYKLIVETATSICEAAAYIKSSKDISMFSICNETINALEDNIGNNKDSLKSNKISEIILKLSSKLKESSYDVIDEIILLADEFRSACINDIDYKIKVLIVAELGGKWDALASVYDALKKRDDCEVEVVIEPVYRAVRLPDGTVRNDVILEDFLTPMGIVNIPYNKYDISKSNPDITFYSQPYDGCTVPMFRTDNLARYSKLVYCPYFSADTLSKNLSSAQESFFKLPSQQYSWKIACQSELMKKYYKIFASRKGENLIVSGIPKWDYPMKLNKENTPCPQNWIKKLEERKVFLWNSHFSSLNVSANAKNIFSYEKRMIDIFKGNKKAALIWRPHPMADTVLKVYSPEKYAAYQKLLKDAESCENIVVDKNSTYDAAFVWSDALISSYSSLFTQYIMTGKPYVIASSSENIKEEYYTSDGLFDFSKINLISDNDVAQCVEDICNGKDDYEENRKYIRENFLKLADGNCGKRFVEQLLDDFYSEAFPETAAPDKKVTMLVIGQGKDIKPCISSLKEHNVKYFVCKDYIENVNIGNEKNLIRISEIKNELFDFVIITDRKNKNIINHLLTTVYGIDNSKIIDFWKLYKASLPTMVCDRVMMNPKIQNYEGIILGISHTEVGIIAEQLKAPFCNLSVSSQDIYYQLKTLQYCIENYSEKIKKLKYAIIDFYDYKYFNYDTSLSVSAVNYISYGGYNLDAHNFERNKNFDKSYETYVNNFENNRMIGVSDVEIGIWNELFSDVHKYADYEGFGGNFDIFNRLKEVNQSDLDSYSYTGGSARKVFPETIEENKKHIRTLFDTLKSINPDIKIYAVIVPKYIEAEIRQAGPISKFVETFNAIVEDLHNEYDFTFLDFNKISDISMNKAYYYDAAHLNYFGAKKLTEELNEIIFK